MTDHGRGVLWFVVGSYESWLHQTNATKQCHSTGDGLIGTTTRGTSRHNVTNILHNQQTNRTNCSNLANPSTQNAVRQMQTHRLMEIDGINVVERGRAGGWQVPSLRENERAIFYGHTSKTNMRTCSIV